MEIVNVKIEDLIPYENNPRNNEDAVKFVVNSINEFGFKVPIVIDKNNVIVAGHTRYKAAKELNLSEVPCIIADDLTEEQIKAFRLADNKISEKASWDNFKLDLEIESLNMDMALFGFESFEESNVDVDSFFADSEEVKEKEPKEIQCPHCKMWFTQ